MNRNPAELRAHVYRDRVERKWWIDIDDPTRNTDEEEALGGTWTGFAHSWPEAMQLAYKMMHDLDRLLMDEVHASRASRRAQRCAECGEVVPEGKAHWKLSEDPCIVLGADQIDADLTEDTYPMEATA